jgi:protease-4
MKFLLNLLSSIIGTIIGFGVLFLIMLMILLLSIPSGDDHSEPYIAEGSIIELDFTNGVSERITEDPFQKLLGESGPKVSMEQLRNSLPKVVNDDRVSGISIRANFLNTNWATLEEIQGLVKNVAESDKFVYLYTDDIGINEKTLFAFAYADSIISPPESFFEFDGFFIQSTFYDGLFEKIGIEAEITRHGKYKGAVEPYVRKNLSDENEYQLQELLDSQYSSFTQTVAEKLGTTADDVDKLLNEVPSLSAVAAHKDGLVDALMYPDEYTELLKQKAGTVSDPEKITAGRYADVTKVDHPLFSSTASDKIAVLQLNGMILPVAPQSFGEQPSAITFDLVDQELEKIEKDKSVKALVVQVNSPGGAGTTSDLIWNRLKKVSEKMPVIASMNGVAASGGYYIAMSADTIIAAPNTITGSIGVFGTKFSIKKLMNENIGITFDVVKTNPYADWLTQTRDFRAVESQAFQQMIDEFYDTFIQKVADSRGISVERADELGQGRVWSGKDAQDVNLVDLIGGLNEALGIAGESAGLEKFSVEYFPKPKTLMEQLFESSGSSVQAIIKSEIPDFSYFNQLSRMQKQSPYYIHALLPVDVRIE